MYFIPQKESSLRETTSFDVLRAQIGRRVWSGRATEKKKKKKKNKKKKSPDLYISRPRRGATADPNFPKLGRIGGWPDVITATKFQLDRLTTVGLAWVESLPL